MTTPQKPLGDRIKYLNRPMFGFKKESDLFKYACMWITTQAPDNTYFQVRLIFNNWGVACDCLCEVFQNDVSLGEYSVLTILDGQTMYDFVPFS